MPTQHFPLPYSAWSNVRQRRWVHDLLPRYIPNTITKMRACIDTGVFRHDVEGLLG